MLLLTVFDVPALTRDHFAYNLVAKMIHQTPEERPKIAEVSGQLKISQFGTDRTMTCRLRRCLNELSFSGCRKQRCDDPNPQDQVICCSFHPSRPKLACGLDGGRICLFGGRSHTTPFGQWNKKRILQAQSEAEVVCIDWNVRQLSIICTVVLNEKSLLQVCGCKLAAGLKDGTVVVWNEDGTKSFELKQHSDLIISISWNGEEEKSHLFVTGSVDQVNNLQIE